MLTTRFKRLARAIRNAATKPDLGPPYELQRRPIPGAPALWGTHTDLDGMDHAATIRAQAVAMRRQLAKA